MDGALGAAGTSAAAVGLDKLSQMGVLYHGLEIMGGGAILSGLVLGAIGVFIIERKFVEASAFAAAGAVLTYFGFMHGEAVGIGGGLGVTPAVALSYAVVAGFLYGCGRVSEAAAEPAPAERVSAAVPAE
jgi:AGZA family xanthine/uracil permease-like MFS transporter